MPFCSACGTNIGDGVRFCSSCGSAVSQSPAIDEFATMDYVASTPRKSASAAKLTSSSHSLLTEGRFLPGRLVAGRYRIIALLGRGGMGEVYRADDLTLGQPVALKFLPEEASQNENLLERFRNEVRVARKVSHPNVCRVYDVGDVDGATFFTMEYIDGEDLASLLRRIGRLPSDKALEIARQLCAGLAAAHAKGVLHRDLKPANIMLDGRGQVVMTDFGLAGLIDQIQGGDIRSGTPAYMAPEQLEGKEVSVRSDIYSLGLVLYEIFTGKRAFTAESLPDMIRTRTESEVSKPSSLVKDLDPAVERVIMRCLEAEPARRPASVMTVAAALPGGDPLAAALAAGETPSPQMVAAAGETEGLPPRTALLCFAGTLIGLAVIFYLAVYTGFADKINLDQPPAVLTQKARDFLKEIGYADKPADYGSHFFYDYDYLHYVERNNKRPDWAHLLANRPTILGYWYRQSPEATMPTDFHDMTLTPGVLDDGDPPLTRSGMVIVYLDMHGRLMKFQAIPPERDDVAQKSAVVDWGPLFSAAGIDIASLQSAEPVWASLGDSDTRAAWTGTWPGGNLPLRVEAAAYRGKPVFFSLIGPWTTPSRMASQNSNAGQGASQTILIVILFLVIGGGVFLARKNSRRKQSDLNGAARLAYAIFVLQLLLWIFRSHFVADASILLSFVLAVSTGLFLAAMAWALYLALEPYIRKYWPHSIISWSRLLLGRFRDPVVGRDILFGVILGVVWILLIQVSNVIAIRQGAPPDTYSTPFYMDARQAFGIWLFHIPGSIQGTLIFFFMLLFLRIVLRVPWLANIVFVLIWVVIKSLGQSHPWITIAATTLLYGIAALVVNRFGLVALAVGIFVTDMLAGVPFTTDFSAWYAPNTLFALLSVAALAGWGFYHSLGGQPLFKTAALD